MNKTLIDRYNRQGYPEEQLLYNHLIERVQVESYPQMIERFQTLFIEGVGYKDGEILTALEKITCSKRAQEEFKYILNRCCHILINRWQASPNRHNAIPELVKLFDTVPTRNGRSFRSLTSKRLFELVQQFTETDQYLTLKRLAAVMNAEAAVTPATDTTPLRVLIPRYPYLYEHCLISEDSSYEHQEAIKTLQAQRQRQFELDLSQYVTHQVRQARSSKTGSSTQVIQTLKNPTLLDNRELAFALKQFVGKVDNGQTYRDMAQSFLNRTNPHQSYKAFKNDLYEYLTPAFADSASRKPLNDRLYKQLQNTLSHSDSKQFSDFLMMRTCNQLLNFLVVESPQKPNHFVFVDLIANLGPTLTTGLLLKIVLICSQVKPYLEKRFSILFNHYEATSQQGVQWLVKALENVNLALCTNFGNVDLSFIR